MLKKLFSFIALAVGLLVGSAAFAQQTASVQLTWTNPTTTVVGGPLTGADAITKFQFWFGTSDLSTLPLTPTLELPASATLQTNYTFTAAFGSTVYARMKVCSATVCSAATSQVTASVPYPSAAPGAPQNLTIKVTIP